MKRYKDNAKWLAYLAPFQSLSISAAYLIPFFLQKGMNLTEIFLLQSIFSVASVIWEIPSGWIADRYGRALSIKISAPIAALTFMAYGFCSHYWQFVIAELLLAIANGLVSGIDTALLLDSLKADNASDEFVKISQRILSYGFAATAVGVPISVLLVKYVTLGATLTADGILIAIGGIFAFRLVEAPQFNDSSEQLAISAWHSMKQLANNVEARWLIVLGGILSTATYLGFWLTAPYYTSLKIPVVLFGVILAIRSAWKAILAHQIVQKNHLLRNMIVYLSLAGLVFVAMATKQIWLVWMVLGHDAIQSLQSQPILAKLNEHMHADYRATLNSMVNMIQRLFYSLVGPLIGFLVDKKGLQVGFLVIGLSCSAIGFYAVFRLYQLKTFKERR